MSSGESESIQVTALIHRALEGDHIAEEGLLEHIYDKLRGIAHGYVKNGGSVEATQIVHDVWMNIFHDVKPDLKDRSEFFKYTATAMRNLLTNHARSRKTKKRGGEFQRQPLDGLVTHFEAAQRVEMLDFNDALEWLRQSNERQFRTVEMKHFLGMPMEAIANILGVSLSTTEKDWAKATAKLRVRLRVDLGE